MAAPNLANPTTITGKTAVLQLASTSETTLLTNAASSNKCLRVGQITVTNTGSATINVTGKFYSAASGGTGYSIGTAVSLAPGVPLILVGKENPIYLEEDRRITITASASSGLDVVCSYEDIS
jgi:hypothetical protein